MLFIAHLLFLIMIWLTASGVSTWPVYDAVYVRMRILNASALDKHAHSFSTVYNKLKSFVVCIQS